MDRTGLGDGDVVAVHKTSEASTGTLVVARLGDEVTLKRFVQVDERHVELRPESFNRRTRWQSSTWRCTSSRSRRSPSEVLIGKLRGKADGEPDQEREAGRRTGQAEDVGAAVRRAFQRPGAGTSRLVVARRPQAPHGVAAAARVTITYSVLFTDGGSGDRNRWWSRTDVIRWVAYRYVMPMKAHIAAVQAAGLRRVAADLDRVWVDCLEGDQRHDDVPAEKFLGSMLGAPVLRALAAELALKAIAIKTTGRHKRGHNLLKLFDALDQNTQTAIEQQRKGVVERVVHGSVRSILEKHKDDFTASRYVGEIAPGSKPTFAYGVDLDVALQDLIAVLGKTAQQRTNRNRHPRQSRPRRPSPRRGPPRPAPDIASIHGLRRPSCLTAPGVLRCRRSPARDRRPKSSPGRPAAAAGGSRRSAAQYRASILATVAGAAPVAADSLVKNIARTTASASDAMKLSVSDIAQRFTTGNNTTGYCLESISIEFAVGRSYRSDPAYVEAVQNPAGEPVTPTCLWA